MIGEHKYDDQIMTLKSSVKVRGQELFTTTTGAVRLNPVRV